MNEDIKDSDIYSDLIAQIAPKDAGVNKFAMKKDVSTTDNLKIRTKTDILKDLTERAEMMLEQAEKISASADGGPCSRVCARETLRSAPHRH